MKIISLLLLFFFTLSIISCGQDLLETSAETLGSYDIGKDSFYINIAKINGGATSSDFMQIRRVFKDSTFEVIKNIPNVDSIVKFTFKNDTINLIARGKLNEDYILSDSLEFSVYDFFTRQRFKIRKN